MLNRKTLISIIAVLCCTQAFGAASVRTVGAATTPNAGGTTARAGSLRTVSTHPTSSNAKTIAADVDRAASVGRIATSTPGSGIGVKTGKVLVPGSGVGKELLAELERQIEELRGDVNSLGNQYSRLTSDVSDASSLAVTAKQMSENNNTQMALKLNTGDFNRKFDERAADLATQGYVQSYVRDNAPTPNLTNYYTKGQVDTELAKKINAGEDFNNAFTARLAATSVESSINDLSARVLNTENKLVNLEENPSIDTIVVGNMIDNKISNLASKTEVANTYSTKDQLLDLAGYVDTNTASIGTLTNQLNDKISSSQFNSLSSQVSTNAQSLVNKVDVGVFNSLSSDINTALAGKADKNELNFMCDDPDFQVETITGGEVPLSRVKMLCKGVQKGAFQIQTGGGGSNAVCGVTLDKTALKQDSSNPDKITGYRLRFNDSCTNEQVGDDVVVNNGEDGTGGGCGTVVTASKAGTKTTLVGRNSCTNEEEWTEEINDGADGTGGGCGTVVTASKSGSKTTLVGRNSCTNEEEWTEEVNDGVQSCGTVVTASKSGTKTTLVGRNSCTQQQEWSQEVDDGAPGAGIEYQGIVQHCTELHTHDGATQGYAWFNKGDNLLYISDGTSFPTCPDGGVPFQGEQGEPGCGTVITASKSGTKTTLTARNSCTNAQEWTEEVNDGTPGDNGCGTVISASKSGTKTTLTARNSCTNAQEWTQEIDDGTQGCGTIISASKSGAKTTLTARNSCTQQQEWTQEIDDGTPGTGIEYQGIVQTCTELHTHDGATKGYAWFNKGDNLLYISDGSGFPTCPDGGVPFKGDQGEPGCGTVVTASKSGTKTTLTARNSCTNAQEWTQEVNDGEPGDDGCGTIISASKSGTKTTLTARNSCTNAQEWTQEVNDGTQGCGSVVTASKSGTKTTLTSRNSCTNAQEWTQEVNDGAAGDSCALTTHSKTGKTATFGITCGSNAEQTLSVADGNDGNNGTTFTPSVSSAGDLSWSNTDGKPNPTTVNIRGPKGDDGQGICPKGEILQIIQRQTDPTKVDFNCIPEE